MPDGVRLAADLYMPTGGVDGDRFPVLLEYLPYRKDDSRPGRYRAFSYFVQRGYVVARVDIRGTGNSEGRLIEYEYTDQEQEDGEVVIDWLSKQAFSTGRVGMFGISWGGFNSIQMAMRRPPALRTIIALMATDDIFLDDVHFTDGIMRLDAYEMGQDLTNALPGAPDFVIDEDITETVSIRRRGCSSTSASRETARFGGAPLSIETIRRSISLLSLSAAGMTAIGTACLACSRK